MAGIQGTDAAADKLNQVIVLNTKAVIQELGLMKRELSTLSESDRDQSYETMSELYNTLYSAIMGVLPEINQASDLLSKYSAFIRDEDAPHAPEWGAGYRIQGSIGRAADAAEMLRSKLEAMGVSDFETQDAVITFCRIQMEAAAIREMHGEPSQPLQEADIRAALEAVAGGDGTAVSTDNMYSGNMSEMVYGFKPMLVNGRELEMYDDPLETAEKLIHYQGDGVFPVDGVCAICQCGNVGIMAGMTGITRDSMISRALHMPLSMVEDMDLGASERAERGGLTVEGEQLLLEDMGIETYQLPVQWNKSAMIDQLAEEVQNGKGVILNVDVEHLWSNGQKGGHAISLLSVDRAGDVFIYSDTGAGTCGVITRDRIERILDGFPAVITTDPIRGNYQPEKTKVRRR